ncbi:MAG TPA: hypothetical protein VH597_17250 [Verrucomicrobiae bacterium]|jgi:hypothetical protein|nr:hypothetical protein [Verrucomicrobiae bacterium]
MKTLLRAFIGIVLTSVALALLPGCASMRVLSSTPPVKAFVLEKPAEFTFGLGTKVTFPAGEYKPVMEDNDGYYYQAPSKVVARDLFSYVADGGLYLRRAEMVPTRWYVIDQQNYTKTGKLPKDFSVKAIE